MSSGTASQIAVEPSTSVNRKVVCTATSDITPPFRDPVASP